MIRIAVTLRAYRAIKATLPEGSVVYPPERDGRGPRIALPTHVGKLGTELGRLFLINLTRSYCLLGWSSVN